MNETILWVAEDFKKDLYYLVLKDKTTVFIDDTQLKKLIKSKSKWVRLGTFPLILDLKKEGIEKITGMGKQ